jgi:hypothetical protein
MMASSGFNASFGTGNQYGLINSQGSDKKGQGEYKKIFCAYHSTEFLTNFCIDSTTILN